MPIAGDRPCLSDSVEIILAGAPVVVAVLVGSTPRHHAPLRVNIMGNAACIPSITGRLHFILGHIVVPGVCNTCNVIMRERAEWRRQLTED